MIILDRTPKPGRRNTSFSASAAPGGVRKDARKAIEDELLNPMIIDVTGQLTNILSGGPAAAESILSSLLERWRGVFEVQGPGIASRWARDVNGITKDRFESGLTRALGVNRAEIIDGEGIAESVRLAGGGASRLITDMSGEYMDNIFQAVLRNFRQEPQPEGRTFIQQIQESAKISRERAVLIARDQTAKMNSEFNQARMIENGVEEYTWRTAGGIRVAGNPAGLYPNAKDDDPMHGNHWKRNGKKFRLDSPPPDGHPGMPILCRCRMDPHVNMNRVFEKGNVAVSNYRPRLNMAHYARAS